MGLLSHLLHSVIQQTGQGFNGPKISGLTEREGGAPTYTGVLVAELLDERFDGVRSDSDEGPDSLLSIFFDSGRQDTDQGFDGTTITDPTESENGVPTRMRILVAKLAGQGLDGVRSDCG